jgi:hypothetical protein
MTKPNDGGQISDWEAFSTAKPSLHLFVAWWSLAACLCLVGWATTANKSEPYEFLPELDTPRLYTVVTYHSEYKDLTRAGSGEFATPQGKRIRFEEPHTEIEQ